MGSGGDGTFGLFTHWVTQNTCALALHWVRPRCPREGPQSRRVRGYLQAGVFGDEARGGSAAGQVGPEAENQEPFWPK